MPFDIPPSWQPALKETLESPTMQRLAQFVAQERQRGTVYPPEEELFTALKLTPLPAVRVLLLGQDPYHDANQAHGLCFSVRPGVKPPPSLVNIFRELHSDLGCRIPNHGCLVSWARQGVLLLNTVLTVRAHSPRSHRGRGWEEFTDAVIRAVNAKTEPVVFVLWGGEAQRRSRLIDAQRHPVVQMAHPSPLSAHNGFFGSRPFSRINAALRQAGKPEIDWQIPDLPL
jgi:uracil-DNA glycosylase